MKVSSIIVIILLITFILIIINGGDYGIEKKTYRAEVLRVDVLGNPRSSYLISAYVKITLSNEAVLYTNIASPFLEKGQLITVSCSKRLITSGFFCYFESE